MDAHFLFQTFPDKALKRELAVQAVTCPNKPEGCEWDGTFKDYEEVNSFTVFSHLNLEFRFSSLFLPYCG